MIERLLMGWSQPPLRSAVEWLSLRACEAGGDLSRYSVVLPTSLAKRRLEAELARRAKTESWPYFPPRVLTVGALPEELYLPQRPFADTTVQRLAWAKVLRESPAEQVSTVAGRLPARDDDRGWCQLGELLGNLRRELASDQLDCAAVLAEAAKLDGFQEEQRWKVLAQLERAYLNELDRLELWDKQAARLEAIRLGECATDSRIVLLGTVDLNRTMRSMLDAVANQVTALIFAPDAYADHFDSHGCLIPSMWETETLQLGADVIGVAEGPAELAAATVSAISRAIDETTESVAADDVVIGLPDERFIPYLRRAIRGAGADLRYGPGRELLHTSPVRLWEAMAAWLATQTFADFAQLVRHPLVAELIDRSAGVARNWLADIDDYYNEYLPGSLRSVWAGAGSSASRAAAKSVQQIVALLRQWLEPLAQPKFLAEWGNPLRTVMNTILGNRELSDSSDADRVWLAALRQFDEIVTNWRSLPESVDIEVTGAEALAWLVDGFRGARVPEPPDSTAIEAHGWLELPWDDAPIVIVAGMNEGVIPQAINADPFLPNRLRQSLGLDDNSRRFARDFFATRLLLESHRQVRLLAGRRNSEGDPLLPSRLWFCQTEAAQLRAVDAFLSGDGLGGSGAAESTRAWLVGQGESPQEPPKPPALTQRQREKLTVLRVTQFRDYLACPYRFYLRHVLGLAAVNDDAMELNALAFGSLAHDVLAEFGESELSAVDDAESIAAFLGERLEESVQRKYGSRPLVAVHLQQELLRKRLEQFAAEQAKVAQAGWRIVQTEYEGCRYVIGTEHGEVEVKGRIDRIDWHAGKKELRIWDYKTGDGGSKPEQTHRKGRAGSKEWIDLQLPLYRHLLPEELLETYPAKVVSLGYILLPKASSDAGFAVAKWSDTELADADRAAKTVAQKIAKGVFWPRKTDYKYTDDLSEICMEGMLT